MKRKNGILITVLTLVSIVALAGGQAAGSEKPIELIFSHNEPLTSFQHAACEEWAAKIAEATSGRITVEIFGGGALGSERDTLERIKQGAADITLTTPSLFEGMFPYVQMFQLPLLGVRDGKIGTNVLWDLYEEFPDIYDNMFKSQGLKALGIFTTDASLIGSTKDVRSVNDLKGLRMRCSAGPLTDVALLWNVAPVTLGQSEIYEAVEKNVIDGFFNVWPGTYSFRLYEVCHYILDIPIFCNQLMILMGLDQWNALSPELQDILMKNSGRDASVNVFYAGMAKNTVLAKDAILAYGSVINVPTEEEYNTFVEGAEIASQNWLKQYTTGQVDATALYNRAKELLKNY